jgi:hypothetical protein
MALLQKAYLGATPLFRNTSFFDGANGVPINASGIVTITADSSAHTKGAWSPLIASTSANASFIIIEAGDVFAGSTDTATLVDIGTGASGSETALIENVAIGSAARIAIRPPFAFGVPIQIPSGVRLSARIQSVVTGGKTATIRIFTFDLGDYAAAPTSVDVIGTDTATSTGTAMSGASGTWTPLIASTSRAYRAIVVVPSASATAMASVAIQFTLGKGASGSETEIGRVFGQFSDIETAGMGSLPTLIPASVASGTRLAVRHDLAGGASGPYDITLIGIP